ncbi:unnamed protein product [Auanema sp. JU1783]|nr:unnamed protein product [Auanema sp. JU1783]
MAGLYEDDFVCLTDSVLTVKNYYFPNKKCRRLSVEAITILWFEEEDLGKCSYKKTWGKSQNGIYWALDVKRCYRLISDTKKCNVVIHYGSKDLIGFTVANAADFMESMRGVLDYHVIIVNSINL